MSKSKVGVNTTEISRGSKSRMVVVTTEVKGVKNRKGLPYKTSVTKHLPLRPKKVASDAK